MKRTMLQGRLPGFGPPQVGRCRVCKRPLKGPASIAAGIGPKCRAGSMSEEKFLERMDGWNTEGDDSSYPCVKMGDVNRLLGIIKRLKGANNA